MIGFAALGALRQISIMEMEPSEMLAGFARRIIAAREWRGYATQADFGKALNLRDFDRLSVYESGRGFPRVPLLYRMARLLGVTADWLLFGDPRGLAQDAYAALAPREMAVQQGTQKPRNGDGHAS